MKEPFFARRSFLGLPNALIILMIVFFVFPFAGRGARMALRKTENNVKDWLPDSFRETEELAWFARRFVSEQFVIATWQNCTINDQRLRLFIEKLRAEVEPPVDIAEDSDYVRAKRLGAEYALFAGEDFHTNWGGANEKWLIDEHGAGFYITPDGRLYRWNDNGSVVSFLTRTIQRTTGTFQLAGQFIASFSDPRIAADKPNPFYVDPRLLTAPLFKKIETGPDLVEQLAGEGGPLATPAQPNMGRRDAIDRLTGTLFGPAVPNGFSWQAQDLPQIILPDFLAEFPDDWRATWDLVVTSAVDAKFDGNIEKLKQASPIQQAEVWYEFFDSIALEVPNRQTCVMITMSDVAKRNLKQVVGRGLMGHELGRVFQLASDSGINLPPRPSSAPPPFNMLAGAPVATEPVLHVGGPPIDNVSIDEEGTITLVRLLGYSVILGLGLSFACLGSIRLMMMVFFVGGVSAIASLGMVWWAGSTIDAILLTMPSLVYVLGMSGAIHIINYYRDIVREDGAHGAADKALQHAIVPCTLAALTTAIGLISLCTSNILPIRKFGLFSALGVMATLMLLYLFLPAALTMFPPRKEKVRQPRSSNVFAGFWDSLIHFIVRRHWLVNAACLLIFVVGMLGLPKIQTSVQLLKMFDQDAQIIRDYRWMEQNFGRLVPMELVVRFPVESQRSPDVEEDMNDDQRKLSRRQLSLLERAQAVAHVQEILQNEFGDAGQNLVGRGMSAITFLRDMPDPSRGFDAHRLAYDRLLQQSREELLKTDYLRVESADSASPGKELWRISLRLGALNDVDYGQFVNQLRKVVEPIVASYRCRAQIIEAILKHSADATDRLRGDVLVLGYSNPAELQQVSDGAAASQTATMDGERIFAKTLAQCLTNETVRQTNWHDPVRFPLSDGKATSQKWREYLSQFACVVIMRDHADYDWQFIRESNPHIVDARTMLAEAATTIASQENFLGVPVELGKSPQDMDVVYTGVVPVVYKAQRTLLESLIQSVEWSFALIALVMAINLTPATTFLASLRPLQMFQAAGAGLVSMLPNLFPLAIIFGFMGWTGTQVDIGTMMTASVALGIAVDDTIHFLAWFRQALRDGLSRQQAIFYAYMRCAPAMTQTTIVGGLGLSVFALSTFTPTQRFGTLMLALLVAALLGDLIFLPALLASPLGRFFLVKPTRKPGADDGQLNSNSEPQSRPEPATESPVPRGGLGNTLFDYDNTQLRRDQAARPGPQRPKLLRHDQAQYKRHDHL